MVTHLAYANDVVIFTSGLKASITLVKAIVDGYCAFSGQRVNCQKSCYLVHPTLSLQRRAMIGMVTGFSYKSFPIKYLGCPLYIGRRRMHYFAELCDMVTARILSWKNRVLSFGDKIVLLKSVLSSMPIHLLAAASPPKGVIASLERVMTSFLWSSTDMGQKFHWLSWGELCRPHQESGIGVRSLAKVYDAFSIKLWWNFRLRRSLWAVFFVAKNCSGVHPCLAKEGFSRTPTWRRLWSIQ